MKVYIFKRKSDYLLVKAYDSYGVAGKMTSCTYNNLREIYEIHKTDIPVLRELCRLLISRVENPIMEGGKKK